jgi:hypothetical protein
MCAANVVPLAISIAALLALAAWTGYLSFGPSNQERVRQLPNWLVFGLMGVSLLALLGLALGPCD